MSGELRIGTSGWHYPNGKGKWDGIFYPPKRGRSKSFDELAYYAERFNTVEINTTFYGQPKPEITRSWVERTPPGFEFSVKLYQKFTHPGMYADRVRKQLPSDLDGAVARGMMSELGRPTLSDLDEFKRGLDPLVSAGRLGALLAQFPAGFKDAVGERAYLSWLLEMFRDFPVAVELRHRSWSDAIGDTLALLNEFHAAWVQIDEPKFTCSIRQNYVPNIKGFYYMRLHGRNAAQWWRHGASEDRYNYLYSAAEVTEFVETVKATREIVQKTYVYTNNHFSAKSVANAAMIKQQLGEPIDGEYPDAFVTEYPELQDVVQRPPSRLTDRAQQRTLKL